MSTPFNAATYPLEKGVTLIEASAGTGKTYSIASLFLRLILELGVPVQSILAVTYTTAATKELRERIRTRLHAAARDLARGASEDPIVAHYLDTHPDTEPGRRALNLAEQCFDEARIFTIHGFCQRVLQERAFESGSRYEAELIPDARPLLEEAAADFWRSRFHEASPLLAALALAQGESPEGWVELLEQTRNHPNLHLLPEPEPESCDRLAARLEAAFAALRSEWSACGAPLEALLQADKTLRPGERTRRIALLPVLERLGNGSDPDTELIEALEAFSVTAIAEAAGKNKTPLAHPFFERCEALGRLAAAFFNQLTHEALAHAAEELPRRKQSRNVMTYDDLLTRVHAALHGPHGRLLARAVGGSYQAALIDEFQDTDPLQYEIFQRFFGNGGHWLFFIGDPKQAIYGFRGADIFTYMQAARSAARRATLVTNRRSDQALLEAFNAFFSRQENPFLFKAIQYYPVHSHQTDIPPGQTPPLEFRYLPCEAEKGFAQEAAMRALAGAAAGDLARLHSPEGGGWPWGNLAVLVRTHRQAAAVQQALARRGLRGVLHTEESVFHSPQAAELQRVMEAALAPGHRGRLHAALSTPLLGLDGNTLAALPPEEHQRWVERAAAWRTLWREEGFTPMFRRLLDTEEVRRRVMSQPGGERRLTNVLHLAELLHEAETALGFTPEALLEWFAEQRAADRSTPDAAQLRLESDGDAVQIVTVHQSKGLEYDVVLCPFLWCPADTPRRQRVQFHDEEGRLTLDLRGKRGASETAVRAHAREALAEEMRLLYVAVTRARHRCLVYGGDIQQPGLSALAHLLGGEMRNGMEALAGEFPERIIFSMIEPESEPSAETDAASPAAELAARVFPGAIHPPAFLTSFTGLTAGTSREEPERDRPAQPDRAPAEAAEGERPGIFQFGKGARAGEFFHDVLEHLDFRRPGQLAELVPAKLAAYGLGGTPHAAAIQAKLAEVLEVELEPGLALRQIAPADRLSEAEFSARLPALRPEMLREVFAEAASPALDPEALGELRFAPVAGFLRGFIDLFFRHEGRYYLLDWKSNWLGDRPEDYDEPGVNAAMRAHHYALQAHLYVLAADRFLARRLPGYDYERHFGGVFYLFLRGIERENPRRGIHRLRPSLALVEKLRALTEQPR